MKSYISTAALAIHTISARDYQRACHVAIWTQRARAVSALRVFAGMALYLLKVSVKRTVIVLTMLVHTQGSHGIATSPKCVVKMAKHYITTGGLEEGTMFAQIFLPVFCVGS